MAELDRRERVVSDLKHYLEGCQSDITGILQRLDWSPNHFIQKEDQEICSVKNEHIVPESSLQKHTSTCELRQRGYSEEDVKEILNKTNFFYSDAQAIGNIDIDKDTLNGILWQHHVKNHSIFYGQKEVPLTHTEAARQLSPAERAAVYDYVVQKAKEENKVIHQEKDEFLTLNLQEIAKLKAEGEAGSKAGSYLEYLKAERDYKRRRQTYRAKNVHITKKSYTEIIREVIENQTELLSDYMKQDESQEECTAGEADPANRVKDKQGAELSQTAIGGNLMGKESEWSLKQTDRSETTLDIINKELEAASRRVTDRRKQDLSQNLTERELLNDRKDKGEVSDREEKQDERYRDKERYRDRERHRRRERSFDSDSDSDRSSRKHKKSHKKHKHKHHKHKSDHR